MARSLLSKRIAKVIRLKAGNNQSAFARKVGANPGLVSMWVAGARSPSANYRRSICTNYSISSEWLDTGRGSMDNRINGLGFVSSTKGLVTIDIAKLRAMDHEMGRVLGTLQRAEQEVGYYRSEFKQIIDWAMPVAKRRLRASHK